MFRIMINDMFAGVNYEINIANEPGSRIGNLTWPDGTPVADDDEFDIAVNNYRAVSQLLVPGVIYEGRGYAHAAGDGRTQRHWRRA